MFQGCSGLACGTRSLQSRDSLLPGFVCCLSRLLNIQLPCGLIFIIEDAEMSGGGCYPGNAQARPALPRSTDRVRRPSGESRSQPYLPHSEGSRHRILEEQQAVAVYDEIGQRSLERLFPRLTEDSTTQTTLSAGQSAKGFKRARDIAAPAHLGALIAAKPHIQGMIQDAVRGEPSPYAGSGGHRDSHLHLSQRTRQ